MAKYTDAKWDLTSLKKRKKGSVFFVEDGGRALGYAKVIRNKAGLLYLNIYTLDDRPVGSYTNYEAAKRALFLATEQIPHDDDVQGPSVCGPLHTPTVGVGGTLPKTPLEEYIVSRQILESSQSRSCTQSLRGLPLDGRVKIPDIGEQVNAAPYASPQVANLPLPLVIWDQVAERTYCGSEDDRSPQSNSPPDHDTAQD